MSKMSEVPDISPKRIPAGTYFIPFRDPDSGMWHPYVSKGENWAPGYLYPAEKLLRECKSWVLPGTWIFIPREFPSPSMNILPLSARLGVDYFILSQGDYDPAMQLSPHYSAVNLNLCSA